MASLFIALFLGKWLDKQFNTAPILLITLPLLVLFGIFYKIFQESNQPKK
jgi:F0F1-type ATP synthase assembly protein I